MSNSKKKTFTKISTIISTRYVTFSGPNRLPFLSHSTTEMYDGGSSELSAPLSPKNARTTIPLVTAADTGTLQCVRVCHLTARAILCLYPDITRTYSRSQYTHAHTCAAETRTAQVSGTAQVRWTTEHVVASVRLTGSPRLLETPAVRSHPV